jgi:hypothetical protein
VPDKQRKGAHSGGITSSRYFSPQKPYTGDGKTTRNIHDTIKLVFKPARKK